MPNPGKLSARKRPVGRPPDRVSRRMDSMAVLSELAARLDFILHNDRAAEELYLTEIEALKTLVVQLENPKCQIILRGIVHRLQFAYQRDLQDDRDEEAALRQAIAHVERLRQLNAADEGVSLDPVD